MSGGAASPLNVAVLAGAALLALGAAMFALGIYHGFEYGSCSTTGYSPHYGPVQHCANGVGWWTLVVMVGLVVAGGGALLSGTGRTFAIPALFVAIGAAFLALGLRGGNSHLLIGRSSGTGQTAAAIFGGCFLIGGVVWGVIAGRSSLSSARGGPLLGALVAGGVGVGAAFGIAAAVTSAIGPTTTATRTFAVATPGVTVSSGTTVASGATVSSGTTAAAGTSASGGGGAGTQAATPVNPSTIRPEDGQSLLRPANFGRVIGLARQQIGASGRILQLRLTPGNLSLTATAHGGGAVAITINAPASVASAPIPASIPTPSYPLSELGAGVPWTLAQRIARAGHVPIGRLDSFVVMVVPGQTGVQWLVFLKGESSSHFQASGPNSPIVEYGTNGPKTLAG